MKKWIGILITVLLIIVGIMGKIYSNAVEPVNAAEKKAIAIAEKKIDFSSVDDFHLYNGLETIYVLEGKDQKGKNIIVWIPEKSHKIFVRKAKSGLTKEEAIKSLKEKKNPEKIVAVRLGMEKNIPFWEIYYLSSDHLINYYCVDFKTGEMVKRIENL
ncbi:DUF5590 domain-containing protein [Neobacillus sp. PS3-34]|uniref:cell wall elongation regulator TseB-like domain-containing protein n=1 Tax=Neobacillus sp. PS3-34 TaxID=3070678 RepID=UPI0027E0ED2C|nr:DUF5590 domain-containing protein [Neobacillus sp. PS3-34]WML47718.1 DUF5590 domain-containing protein [Neobacillus sp. PS3-34]